MAFPNRYQRPFRYSAPPVPIIPTIPGLSPARALPAPATEQPFKGPCLCLPLHWQCSPDTCVTAGAGAREGIETRKPESLAEWAIEITVPNLSAAVLRSCRTCTLIYASLATAGANVRWQPTSQIKVSYDSQLILKPDPAEQHHYELDLLLDPTSSGMTPCLAFPPANPSESTSSHTSFSALNSWLSTCQTFHSSCAHNPNPLLPTRVIYIGKPGHNPVLIQPDDQRAPYIALSHCWGTTIMATTTRATLASRLTSIPLSKLPKSFREAILITRRLGYAHIWIDSLCIVQDDPVDWERESAKMAEIYENAVLTLAASDAVDSQHGCFRDTAKLAGRTSWEATVAPFDPRVVRPGPVGPQQVPVRRVDMSLVTRGNAQDLAFKEQVHATKRDTGDQVKIKRNENGTIGVERFEPHRKGPVPVGGGGGVKWLLRPTLGHGEFDADSYQNSPPFPLTSRGWALQERLLSTRIVHYTAEELVWECKSETWCQCGRIGRNLKQTARESWAEARGKLLKQELEASLGGNAGAVVDMWKLLVFQYTSRRLTYQSDRLPALSGLAKRFRRYGMGEYYAGLWEKKFAEQLLWSVIDDPRAARNRTKEYVAPTWSWASIKEGVFMGARLIDYDNVGFVQPDHEIVGEVVSVETTPLGLDQRGAVKDGVLTIRGSVVNAVVEHEMLTDPETKAERVKFWIVDEVSGQSTHFVPDSAADFDILREGVPVVCVFWNKGPDISSIPGADEHFVAVSSTFIVLKASERRPGMYERMGTWSLWERSAGTEEELKGSTIARVEEVVGNAVRKTFSVI